MNLSVIRHKKKSVLIKRESHLLRRKFTERERISAFSTEHASQVHYPISPFLTNLLLSQYGKFINNSNKTHKQ